MDRGRASRHVVPTRASGRTSTTRATARGSGATWRCVVIVRRRGGTGVAMRNALRIAAPVLPAATAVGASFGVLARTEHFGAVAAVVMSATTFAGSAQIATVSLLGAGGTLG